MVRDGRATVHSIISRKVTITGFDLTNYRQCMQKWNQAITTMHDQCQEIGKERCMMVHYEQLVLQPKKSMEKILEFLDIPWNESVLHHEDFINKENGVALSKWVIQLVNMSGRVGPENSLMERNLRKFDLKEKKKKFFNFQKLLKAKKFSSSSPSRLLHCACKIFAKSFHKSPNFAISIWKV